MIIEVPIKVNISDEESKKICLDYLSSCIPFESEIRYDGLKKYWFQRIYDARGDKVIGFNKYKEVTEEEELISKLLEILKLC